MLHRINLSILEKTTAALPMFLCNCRVKASWAEQVEQGDEGKCAIICNFLPDLEFCIISCCRSLRYTFLGVFFLDSILNYFFVSVL
jgi:hypothetical protein